MLFANLLHNKKRIMKIKQLLLTAALTGGAFIAADAQIQFGASGSYLKGTGDNKASLWGGGLHGKFYLGDHIALGVGVRSYPKNTSSVQAGNTTYTSADLLTNAAASFDLLLGSKKGGIQPYIGADAGVSFSNQTITYTNNNTQIIENKNKKAYVLVAPKVGLNIGLGQTFGIFGQAQYNATFGSGDPDDITINSVTIKSKPVTSYFTFDAGIYVRLKGAGSN